MNLKQYIPSVFAQYDFQRIYSGIESEVYIGFQGNKKIILKYSQAKTAGYYEIEGNIYKELEKQGIKSPRFIFGNNDRNILIISSIEGRELNDNNDLFEDDFIWKKTAKDLASLRNIKCIGFGKIKEALPEGVFKGSLNDWKDFFKKTGKFIDSAKDINIITQKEAGQLYDYWNENEKKINLKRGFVVHGDFCMDHIWTINNEYAGLIDFGDAFIGDSLMDLAYFKLKEINKDYGKKVFNNLYTPYSYLSHDDRSEADKKILINLYMIYWGIDRIVNISEENIRRKFGEKIKTLINEL